MDNTSNISAGKRTSFEWREQGGSYDVLGKGVTLQQKDVPKPCLPSQEEETKEGFPEISQRSATVLQQPVSDFWDAFAQEQRNSQGDYVTILDFSGLEEKARDSLTDEVLQGLLKQFPDVKRLNLEGCESITGAMLFEDTAGYLSGLWKALGYQHYDPLPQNTLNFLEELNLSKCTKLTTEGLFSLLAHAPNLQQLCLNNVPKESLKDLEHLGEDALQKLKVLELQRSGVRLSQETFAWLATRCTQLEILDLSYCYLNLQPQSFSCLQVLKLKQTEVNEATVSLWLKACPKLRHLDLSKNSRLTLNSSWFNSSIHVDEVVKATLARIEFLDLQGCTQLDSAGLGFLLSECTALKHLNIKGCNEISDIAFSGLSSSALTALETLRIGGEDCKNLTQATMGVILLGTSQTLKSLEVRSIECDELFPENFFEDIEGFALEELIVPEYVKDVYWLYSLLKKSPQLRKVELLQSPDFLRLVQKGAFKNLEFLKLGIYKGTILGKEKCPKNTLKQLVKLEIEEVPNDEVLQTLLESTCALQSLRIEFASTITGSCFKALPASILKSLKSVVLDDAKCFDDTGLRALLSAASELECLEVRTIQGGVLQAKSLANIKQPLTKMRVLVLDNLSKIAFPEFKEFLRLMPNLEKLTIKGGYGLADYEGEAFPVCGNLKELTIDRCNSLKMKGLRALIKAFPALKKLEFSHYIQADLAADFWKCLPDTVEVLNLSLLRCDIERASLNEVFKQAIHLRELSISLPGKEATLILEKNDFKDLPEEAFKALEVLSLEYLSVGDDVLHTILERASGLRKLRIDTGQDALGLTGAAFEQLPKPALEALKIVSLKGERGLINGSLNGLQREHIWTLLNRTNDLKVLGLPDKCKKQCSYGGFGFPLEQDIRSYYPQIRLR